MRPAEFSIVFAILALVAVYDLYRTPSMDLPLKRLRFATYGLGILVSSVVLRNW